MYYRRRVSGFALLKNTDQDGKKKWLQGPVNHNLRVWSRFYFTYSA